MASIHSLNLEVRPKAAEIHIHTRAPGPPETMAVATPTIFPVPMVAASAVVSAEKVIHLPVRGSWCGFLAECAFQCIAKVTPCKKSGAHSQEDTGSDQQDQHHSPQTKSSILVTISFKDP